MVDARPAQKVAQPASQPRLGDHSTMAATAVIRSNNNSSCLKMIQVRFFLADQQDFHRRPGHPRVSHHVDQWINMGTVAAARR